MTNDRLRSALASAGMTSTELGARIEVDAKTVDRWIANGRVPHRSNRQRVASALAQDESYLWPDAFSDSYASAASRAEVMTVYPNRGSIPSLAVAQPLRQCHSSPSTCWRSPPASCTTPCRTSTRC